MLDNPVLFEKFGKIYASDEIICCEHEPGDELYFIVEGKVRVSKISQGNEKVVAYLGQGEFIGEMSIFDSGERTATVITEEESKILILHKNDFLKLIKIEPKLVLDLIKLLSVRCVNTEMQLTALLNKSFEKKLRTYIYDKCDKANKDNRKEKRLNISNLASLLNVEVSEVLYFIRNYEKKGLLKIEEENIVLKDLRWLKK